MTLLLPASSRRSKRVSPTTLLRADAEVVPFHGRIQELAALSAWCAGPNLLETKLLAGEAGQGKTRLAQELIHMMIDDGWAAGFLASESVTNRLRPRELLPNSAAILVVVDYAEARVEQLADLLRKIGDSSDHRVRLLLLSRSPGPWWRDLIEIQPELTSHSSVDLLAPLYDSGTEQRIAFRSAVRSFAHALSGVDRADWQAIADAVTPPDDIESDRYESPLPLQTAALSTLLTIASRDANVDTRTALTSLDGLVAIYQDRVKVGHHELTADLAAVLLRQAEVLAARGSTTARLAVTQQAVDLYQELSPTDPRLRPALAEALSAHSSALADVGSLDQALSAAKEAVGLYKTLSSELETSHFADLSGALNNLSILLSNVGNRSEALEAATEAVQNYRFLADSSTDDFRPHFATALSNLAAAIAAVGKPEEALVAASEAVAVQRTLAVEDPQAHLSGLATALNSYSSRLGELGRYEEGLVVAAEAVEVSRTLGARHPESFRPLLAASLNNFAARLSTIGRDEEALDPARQAVSTYRELADAQPSAFLPDLAASLNNLSARLSATGRLAEALDTARSAVEIYRVLANSRPDAFLPDIANSLNNLSNVLSSTGQHEQALDVAQEALAIYRQLVDLRPQAFLPDLAASLNNLSGELTAMGRQDQAIAAATEAVTAYRGLAESRPDVFRADLAISLNNLSVCQSRAGLRQQALECIAEAILLRRALVGANPAFLPDLAASLTNLALQQYEDGERHEALRSITEALGYYRSLADSASKYANDVAKCLAILSTFGANQLEDSATLSEAIDAARTAAGSAEINDPQRARYLSNLVSLLLRSYTITRDPSALDEAVDAARVAAGSAQLDDPQRARYLSTLSSSLVASYTELGDPATLDEAIVVARAALAATVAAGEARAGRLTALGVALSYRYELTQDGAVLGEAIAALTEAVQASSADGADRSHRLMMLGRALRVRFDRAGDLSDLAASIRMSREAVVATPVTDPQRADYLSALGSALLTRSLAEGRQADLDEAVDLARAAVRATAADDRHRAARLSNLSNALRASADRSQDLDVLDAAIAIGREAVEAAASDYPSIPRLQSNLSAALLTRFQWSRQFDALEEAIMLGRQAVSTAAPEDPMYPRLQSNLSNSLLIKFEQSGDLRALDDATAAARAAVGAIPPGHPEAASALSSVARIAEIDFRHNGRTQAARDALEAYRAAARVQAAPIEARVRASRSWGSLAADLGDWSESVTGLSNALGLLSSASARRGTDVAERAKLAAVIAEIARDATSAAVRAGSPERAVELMEQGLVAVAIDGPDPSALSGFRDGRAAGLAERLGRIRTELETMTALSDPHQSGPSVQTETADRLNTQSEIATQGGPDGRMELAREFDSVVAQIRDLPGFGNFLRPAVFSDLAEVSREGPVAMINVSRYGSDALLITTDGLLAVPLPQLSPMELTERAQDLRRALGEQPPSTTPANDAERTPTVDQTLSWLWDVLAEPVLDAMDLGKAGISAGTSPRMWWCPTGELRMMPIHAAGRRRDSSAGADADGESVLDLVVSSYTPSLGVLLDARSRLLDGEAQTKSSALAISIGETPGLLSQPKSDGALRLLAKRFPDLRILRDKQATKDAVLAALPFCRWLHFAGNYSWDSRFPYTATLYLSSTVTFADVANLHLQSAELAFLSAGVQDVQNRSESAAPLISVGISGFRHVVGALWPVTDETAVQVAEAIYSRISNERSGWKSGDVTAHALHSVLRRLRAASDPVQWASYMHIGP